MWTNWKGIFRLSGPGYLFGHQGKRMEVVDPRGA